MPNATHEPPPPHRRLRTQRYSCFRIKKAEIESQGKRLLTCISAPLHPSVCGWLMSPSRRTRTHTCKWARTVRFGACVSAVGGRGKRRDGWMLMQRVGTAGAECRESIVGCRKRQQPVTRNSCRGLLSWVGWMDQESSKAGPKPKPNQTPNQGIRSDCLTNRLTRRRLFTLSPKR